LNFVLELENNNWNK